MFFSVTNFQEPIVIVNTDKINYAYIDYNTATKQYVIFFSFGNGGSVDEDRVPIASFDSEQEANEFMITTLLPNFNGFNKKSKKS